MKRTFLIIAILLSALCANADGYTFNHGPYLQNMEEDEVTIFFTTSQKGFSWVEVMSDEWDKPKPFATTEAGQYNAYNTENRIRITGLKRNSRYRYRLISKEIVKYEPYKVVYGDSIATQWEEFTTPDFGKEAFSFVVTNDGHDNARKVKNLLSKVPLDSIDMVFYLGDMMSYYDKADVPYKAFIDASVELFAKNKPFVAVRGNHEMRGRLTRNYMNIVGCPNDRFYNIAYYGNSVMVILDTGEDKPDTHPVYAGMNCYDAYRMEQLEWLRREAKTKRFKRAKNKIVLMHIPPCVTGRRNSPEEHAPTELEKHFKPLFNEIGIDLTISGHLHNYMLVEKGEKENDFAMIANDNKSIMLVKSDGEGIYVKIVNEKDEVLLERVFK